MACGLSRHVRIFSALLVSPAAALVIGGVRTRRVHASPELPWVLEADWTHTSSGDGGIRAHDPLSSCFWPAATSLAHLISRSAAEDGAGSSYLELGCGTGLCSLTAAASGAPSVLATDVSATSLEYTAAAAAAQGLTSLTTSTFDATDLTSPLPRADVLVLSDVFVTDALARAFAARVAEALALGFARVFVVDPGRTTRAVFLAALTGHQVEYDDFASAEVVGARARAGRRVLLLSTGEGAPVNYCI